MRKLIDLSSLVGSQIASLIEAEVEGAERTSEFIESVGFDRTEDGVLELRLVTFKMTRRDSDGVLRTHTIKIPALTLMPLPLLTIESANIDFSAQVVDVKEIKEIEKNSPFAGKLSRFLGKRHKLVSRLAKTDTGTDSKTKANLKITVKMTQSPFPLGYENLINVVDLSVDDSID